MKNIKKGLKKFVNFCRRELDKDLKLIILFGSSVSSIKTAQDIDLLVVVDDDINTAETLQKLKSYIRETMKDLRFRKDAVNIPFTKIDEEEIFNIVVCSERDLRFMKLQDIFKEDRFLMSIFVPSNLVLMSLKSKSKILYGLDGIKDWAIKVGPLDYPRTLLRSLSLSFFSCFVLPFSLPKSFNISCDSLKHLLENCFILETGMPPRDIGAVLSFYESSWAEILKKQRTGEKINNLQKIKFILSMPIICIIIFVEALI